MTLILGEKSSFAFKKNPSTDLTKRDEKKEKIKKTEKRNEFGRES